MGHGGGGRRGRDERNAFLTLLANPEKRTGVGNTGGKSRVKKFSSRCGTTEIEGVIISLGSVRKNQGRPPIFRVPWAVSERPKRN